MREGQMRYGTEVEVREKWTRPAAPALVSSVALMRQELGRRGVLIHICGCEKPSQGQAEQDLDVFTWLLGVFSLPAPVVPAGTDA